MDHLAAVERDGYVIIERAISASTADALAAEVERLQHQLPIGPGRTSFQGTSSTRVHNLVGRSAGFRELALHPVVLPLVEELLGPDALPMISVSGGAI